MAFRFEELIIWKNSVSFANSIYVLTRNSPREELFSLTDQLKRAVNSVSTNIAEGSGSSSKKDFSHYLDISIKSTYEVASLLYLAELQKYISHKARIELYDETELLAKQIRSFKISVINS